jgi:hypothetical protein
MWKWLAYTRRFSYVEIVFFIISAKAMREDNWEAWGVIVVVWLVAMVSTDMYFDKKNKD